jgi:hypothetical protein
MKITYRSDLMPATEAVIDLYDSAGLDRPLSDSQRISKMYEHSNLIVTAWDGDKLVGIARSLTDFCYCCYVSDLAVRQEYKCAGIGSRLIDLTKEIVGEDSNLLLLSAPSALEFYAKIGLLKVDDGFIIKRTK